VPDDVTATPDPVAGDPVDATRDVPAPEPDGAAPPRVLTFVGLLAGGLVLGFFGTVLASVRTVTHGHTIWWGLALVLVTLLACVRGAAWLVGTRRGAAAVGLGWVLPTLAFTTVNPGGDVLLPDDTRTYVYLVGATLVVVLATALPLPRGARELAATHRAGHGRDDDATDAAALEPTSTDAA
jgi:hypothetical protein